MQQVAHPELSTQDIVASAREELHSARAVYASAQYDFDWHHDFNNPANDKNVPCPLVADMLAHKLDAAKAELERQQNNLLFFQRMVSFGDEPLLSMEDEQQEMSATTALTTKLPSFEHPKVAPVKAINPITVDWEAMEDTLDLDFV